MMLVSDGIVAALYPRLQDSSLAIRRTGFVS
jgi:hypothetical protein